MPSHRFGPELSLTVLLANDAADLRRDSQLLGRPSALDDVCGVGDAEICEVPPSAKDLDVETGLLLVACTRAKVVGIDPASFFHGQTLLEILDQSPRKLDQESDVRPLGSVASTPVAYGELDMLEVLADDEFEANKLLLARIAPKGICLPARDRQHQAPYSTCSGDLVAIPDRELTTGSLNHPSPWSLFEHVSPLRRLLAEREDVLGRCSSLAAGDADGFDLWTLDTCHLPVTLAHAKADLHPNRERVPAASNESLAIQEGPVLATEIAKLPAAWRPPLYEGVHARDPRIIQRELSVTSSANPSSYAQTLCDWCAADRSHGFPSVRGGPRGRALHERHHERDRARI